MDRHADRQFAETKQTRLLDPVVQRCVLRIVLGLFVGVSSASGTFVISAPQKTQTNSGLSQTNVTVRPLDCQQVLPDIEDLKVNPVIQVVSWTPPTASNDGKLTRVGSSDEVVPSPTSKNPIESKFWYEDESVLDQAELPPLPSVDSISAPTPRAPGPATLRKKQAWKAVRENQGWKLTDRDQNPAERALPDLLSKTLVTVKANSTETVPSDVTPPISPLPSQSHSLDFADDVPQMLSKPLQPLPPLPLVGHSLDFASETSPRVHVVSDNFQMTGPMVESPMPVVSNPTPEVISVQDYGNNLWAPNSPQFSEDYHDWGPIRKFQYFNQTNGDIGIGHERVMFAPFEIETSQPANNVRLKMMSALGLHSPDRGSYIWAPIGSKGPPHPESNVNYQNFDAIYEAGGKRFSMVTDVPMRSLHPEYNSSGSGIGNISLAPKTVLIDGSDWQVTHVFRTYLPTGPVQRGTSNGLVSLEPGLLVHYRWSPQTYVHGQAKYWIPMSAGPGAGNVFNYGVGVSHVLHETDSFAIIPVFEAVGWEVAGGTVTLPSALPTPVIQASASTSFVNIQPGVRFVIGPKGDLGLFEFGVSGGFATNATGWYKEQLTLEMRWSW